MFSQLNFLPKWIKWYALFLLILSINTTFLGYFLPNIIFGDLINGQEASVWFYAARNAGIAILFATAFWLKETKLFLGAFLARFVIEFLDLIATIKFDLVNIHPIIILVVWSGVFLIPEGLAIWQLHKLKSPK